MSKLNLIGIIFLIINFSCTVKEKEAAYLPKAIEYNNRGVELMLQKEYDSALILFKKAAAVDETYYLPYSNMANIYLELGQADNALEASEKVIEIDPSLAEGWVYAGMLYQNQGNSLEAIKYYSKSIEIFDERISNPEMKDDLKINRLNRAFSLVLMGREKEGRDEMRKLKTEYPDDKKIDEFLKMNSQDFFKRLASDKISYK